MRTGQTYLPGSDVIFVSGVVMPSRPGRGGRGGAGWPGECLCAGRQQHVSSSCFCCSPATSLETQGAELGMCSDCSVQSTHKVPVLGNQCKCIIIITTYPSADEVVSCSGCVLTCVSTSICLPPVCRVCSAV